MIEARPYQSECVETLINEWRHGVTAQAVSLPTASGKSVIAAMTAKAASGPDGPGGRIFMGAHRTELLDQLESKVRAVWPSVTVGRVQADRDECGAQVVIASIPTLTHASRLKRLAHERFDVAVIDELHHSASVSYKRVLKALGFLPCPPERLLVGFSATVFRADGKALSDVFEAVTFKRSILEMIEAGWLSDLKAYRVETDVDLSGVHTRQGDFATGELARAVNTPGRNQLIAHKLRELAPDRPTLVFCVDVAHTLDMAETLRKHGFLAEAVYGSMHPDERKNALERFTNGGLQTLVNCELLTEGTDLPRVSCIALARPTKSPILFTQMVGRGTRIHPGKDLCLVLDFSDSRNDVCGVPDLLGDQKPRKQRQGRTLRQLALDAAEEAREAAGRREEAEHLRVRERRTVEVNLLQRTGWERTADSDEWRLPITSKAWVTITASHDGLYDVMSFTPSGAQQIAANETLDIARSKAEKAASEYRERAFGQNARWRQEPPSEKQMAALLKLKWHGAAPSTKGEASDILDRLFGRKEVNV